MVFCGSRELVFFVFMSDVWMYDSGMIKSVFVRLSIGDENLHDLVNIGANHLAIGASIFVVKV